MIAERCPKCEERNWRGAQTIYAPEPPTYLWRRRTYCRFCQYATEEVANGLALSIISRKEPTVVGGGNPFDNDPSEEDTR